jgi:hypothetical protein
MVWVATAAGWVKAPVAWLQVAGTDIPPRMSALAFEDAHRTVFTSHGWFPNAQNNRHGAPVASRRRGPTGSALGPNHSAAQRRQEPASCVPPSAGAPITCRSRRPPQIPTPSGPHHPKASDHLRMLTALARGLRPRLDPIPDRPASVRRRSHFTHVESEFQSI